VGRGRRRELKVEDLKSLRTSWRNWSRAAQAIQYHRHPQDRAVACGFAAGAVGSVVHDMVEGGHSLAIWPVMR
jgi:hypothetical protein